MIQIQDAVQETNRGLLQLQKELQTHIIGDAPVLQVAAPGNVNIPAEEREALVAIDEELVHNKYLQKYLVSILLTTNVYIIFTPSGAVPSPISDRIRFHWEMGI